MLPKPKFIYFDLDDTLLDHKSAERAGLKDAYSHFELFDTVEFEKLIATYHQVNKKLWELYGDTQVTKEQLQHDRFEWTLEKLGIDSSRSKEVGSYYLQCYGDHWSWIEGAGEAFSAIRAKFPVGILTNGFSETQKRKFKKFGLHQAADHLIISEDVGYLKPDKRIFDYATRLTGFTSRDILYVGDSYTSDVIGGTEYGWKVAWYNTEKNAEDREKTDFVFNDFKDLITLLEVWN